MATYDPTMEWPRTARQMLVYGSFYGVFLFIGLFCAVLPSWIVIWPQVRRNHLFIETDGVIVDKRMTPTEWGNVRQVRVRYQVDGCQLESWNLRGVESFTRHAGEASPEFDAIRIGEARKVWYDPAEPTHVIVARGYVLHWLWFLIPAVGLVLIASAGTTIARGVIAWRTRRPGGVG
jgi:hypothetical protein